MAYSRGALVVERGLELAAAELRARGISADHIAHKIFSHVVVETADMPRLVGPSPIEQNDEWHVIYH